MTDQQQANKDDAGGARYVSMTDDDEEAQSSVFKVAAAGAASGKIECTASNGGSGRTPPPTSSSGSSSDDDEEDGRDGISLALAAATGDYCCDKSHGCCVESVETDIDGVGDRPGFLVVCMVVFISDVSRGLFFPSLWPLVERELGGTRVAMGYAVAAFALGEALVFPSFGMLSYQIGYTKTLLLSCSILLAGTVAYGQVQNVGSVEFLVFAQTLLGCGSGTFGVSRGFVADVTAKRNRMTYISIVTSIQYAACAVTPFVGALFNRLLGDREYRPLGGSSLLRLNMYTAPALLMTALVAATLVCLLLFFQNRHRIATTKEVGGKKSRKRQAIEQAANAPCLFGFSLYACVVAGCMMLTAVNKGCMASFETLGIHLADAYFGLESSRASSIVAGCGLVGVLALLSMRRLHALLGKDDVRVLVAGMSIMAAGIATLWLLVGESDDNPTWKYAIAMFLIYGLGYPLSNASVTGIFSKIIGRRPQGMLLGWFACAGALARILTPVAAGYVSHYASTLAVFGALATVVAAAVGAVLLSRRTLLLLSS